MGTLVNKWLSENPAPRGHECSCDYMGGMCSPCMDWYADLRDVEDRERMIPTTDLRQQSLR